MGETNLESILRNKFDKVIPSGEGYVLVTCPVHKNGQERHPSLSISLNTGSFRCFTGYCGVKGSFQDLKKLLKDPLSGAILKQTKERPVNDNLDEAVLGIFHKCPVALLEAGFDEKLLMEHDIGYDSIYERITFPIRDIDGRLVAISGRGGPGADPRYKVYPHKMLRGGADYDYSPRSKRFLYGGHTIDRGKPVIVVEGFKGCLWLRQHGYSNTVATMGTKVREEQLSKLRAITDRAIIMFDMDESGRVAGKKIQRKLLGMGLPTELILYNDGASPDDLNQTQLDELLKHYGVDK